MEWVESIRYDSYQRELIWNVFYSNLESIWCDSNLQYFCAQIVQLRNYFRAQNFLNVVASKVFRYVFTLGFHCSMTRQSPSD